MNITEDYLYTMEDDELEKELDVFREETSKIISDHKSNGEKHKAISVLHKNYTKEKWGTKLCFVMIEDYFNDKIPDYSYYIRKNRKIKLDNIKKLNDTNN